jgi:hypothetical protein
LTTIAGVVPAIIMGLRNPLEGLADLLPDAPDMSWLAALFSSLSPEAIEQDISIVEQDLKWMGGLLESLGSDVASILGTAGSDLSWAGGEVFDVAKDVYPYLPMMGGVGAVLLVLYFAKRK